MVDEYFILFDTNKGIPIDRYITELSLDRKQQKDNNDILNDLDAGI